MKTTIIIIVCAVYFLMGTLIYLVYKEAGFWTALTVLIIFIILELNNQALKKLTRK